MKKYFTGLWEWLNNPRHEKPLMLALPCLALLLCALILAPQLSVYRANRSAALERLQQAPPAPDTAPAAPQADGAAAQLHLTVYSEGEDLLITVCDAAGRAVTGERFQLSVTAPGGEEILCATYTDGSCYLVELTPGNYTVTMSAHPGYMTPEPVVCAVSSLTYQAPSLAQLKPGLNRVDGKLYYLSARGEIASAVGLDLSCYNGNIDWEALRGQGVGFVILRLGGRGWGSGLIYRDARFPEYLDAAKAAGLNIGVYFYSTAVSIAEAEEEAAFVLSQLHGMPLELPAFLDMEYSGKYPYGRADRLTATERTQIANAFARVLSRHGYDSGFYSGTYYIDRELDLSFLSHHSVWIANYTKHNALPAVEYGYDIWQYTENGRVRGVYGPVDVNVVF